MKVPSREFLPFTVLNDIIYRSKYRMGVIQMKLLGVLLGKGVELIISPHTH
jgi:hypothetical protein